LIKKAEELTKEEKKQLGEKARSRVLKSYSWKFIASEYEKLFLEV
jgi:glycosyltransferase involved in cell wall biosynthesis